MINSQPSGMMSAIAPATGAWLSQQGLKRLARELDDQRVLSVYVQCDWPRPDPRFWRTRLLEALQLLQQCHPEASLAERVALAKCVVLVRDTLSRYPRNVGATLVAFATPTGLHHVARLGGCVPTRAFWQTGIRLAPYVRAAAWTRPARVYVVGKRQADVYEYANLALHHIERIDAAAWSRDAKRPELSGVSLANEYHPRHRITHDLDIRPETTRVSVTVANRIRATSGAPYCTIMVGAEEVTRMVLAALPAHIACGVRVDDQASPLLRLTKRILADIVERHVRQYDDERQRLLIEQVTSTTASPADTALGVESVEQSLSTDRIRELVVTARFADEAEELTENVVRCALDREVPVAVVEGQHAARLDEMGDGIGALLRRHPSRRLPNATYAGDSVDTEPAGMRAQR